MNSMWQMLQVTGATDREFASALHKSVALTAWSPQMRWASALAGRDRMETLTDPPLDLRRFPLQRGYARFPLAQLCRPGARQLARMRKVLRESGVKEDQAPLVCTTPYWAAVAEQWTGPVVYYLTDLMAAYRGADNDAVCALDRRMSRAATLVCPNSRRLGRYLTNEAGCDPERVVVVPNATRASNLLPAPCAEPLALPLDVADLPRPVAGMIGNLAGNMDWVLIRDIVKHAAGFSWLFVGPFDMAIEEREQRQARADVLAAGGRVRFTGPRPYGAMRDYARAFDVAVLPYFRREPTLSGSSTRFYEHLAACRPIVATAGVEELLEKQPYLKLANTVRDMVQYLDDLAARRFDDGLARARWAASHENTWECRASQIVTALAERTAQVKVDNVEPAAVYAGTAA